MINKIILKNEVSSFRNKYKHKRIVLCHGVFDVVHLGHINHFKSAKKNADILFVSITADKFIKKGPNRPLFDESSRVQMLSQLNIVDRIFISENETCEELIDLLKPNYYAKGIEYKYSNLQKNLFFKEKKALKRNNVKLIFTDDKKLSSTKIINIIEKNTSTKQFGIFNNEQIEFLRKLKKKYNYSSIKNHIENLHDLSFNIIGEPLVDEYIFTKSFSTSSKSPTIATEYVSKEYHPGGAIFISLIAKEFCNNVGFITYANDQKIKKIYNLKKIKNYIFQSNFKIPKITRFINLNYNYKMFQIYEFDKFLHTKESYDFVKKKNNKLVRNICIDFGFGFFDKEIMKYLKDLKKKPAINFHKNLINNENIYLKKFNQASLITMNLYEFEQKFNCNCGNYKQIINVYKKNKITVPCIITLGKDGSVYCEKNKYVYCPTFFNNPIDTVGCGDAFFVMASMLKELKINPDLILFISNCYAGLHGNYLGNKVIVNKKELLQTINTLIS